VPFDLVRHSKPARRAGRGRQAISDAGVNIAPATCIGPGDRPSSTSSSPMRGGQARVFAISTLAVTPASASGRV